MIYIFSLLKQICRKHSTIIYSSDMVLEPKLLVSEYMYSIVLDGVKITLKVIVKMTCLSVSKCHFLFHFQISKENMKIKTTNLNFKRINRSCKKKYSIFLLLHYKWGWTSFPMLLVVIRFPFFLFNCSFLFYDVA